MTGMENLAMVQSGSSRTASTAKALDAAKMIVQALKEPSSPISAENISTKRKAASVHRLASSSPMSLPSTDAT
jgi:hypothetical protein